MNQPERYIRMCKNHLGDYIGHTPGFSNRLFQEFKAYGSIIKQIACNNGRSLRAGRFRNALDDAAFIDGARTALFSCMACSKHKLAYSCNRGESLASEAKRMQIKQIFRFADFACRMTFKCKAYVTAWDTLSVVSDTQIGDAAITDFNRNASGAGVKAVFNQLLDGGSRTFNNFACSNFSNNLFTQANDWSAVHEGSPFSLFSK